jgi:16S rRNA (cytidine1402-2'-O)-methyltransferase
LLALAASGLSGQRFAFVGYLPQEGPERTQKIKALEHTALQTGQTQLFIETPYRNSALLTALLQTLQAQTLLSVSMGLTLPNAWQRSATVKEWKTQNVELDKHTPAVFAIGR